MKKNNNWIFPLAFIILIIFWKFSTVEKLEPNPKIEVYNSSIESIIDINSEIEVIADSISLPEGPVWDNSSNSLLFVDVMGNKLYKWNETDGASVFISPSGNTGYAPNVNYGLLGANGLAIDKDGNIIVCQHGDRRIASIENAPSSDPSFLTVVDNFYGKTLNSPNDLALASDGSIYFTDPAFGFFNLETFQFENDELKEIDYNGVYVLKPDGKIEILAGHWGGGRSSYDGIDLPNGIALSPDETKLYVNKMGLLDGNPKIKIIDLEHDGHSILDLDDQKRYSRVSDFFDGKELSEKYEGNFDGMTVHSSGNIFTSGPGGLLVISPDGELMAKIDTGHLTNATFDDDEGYLYLTGYVSNPKVFRIKIKNQVLSKK